MGKPIQKAIISLRDEVKEMAKDIDLDGPVEVKPASMSLDEQVACIRRKNYNEMQDLLKNFSGLEAVKAIE